jgi:hypothetical protein
MPAPGSTTWYIADAYLSSTGHGELWPSHESVCLLNVGKLDATIRMTLYFADREPIDGIVIQLPARRDLHVRLDQPAMVGGVEIPRDTPYGIGLESDQPVVAQYSRLDVTQPNFSLMTTVPYAGRES